MRNAGLGERLRERALLLGRAALEQICTRELEPVRVALRPPRG
jgi:hypothetical protein